MKVVFQLISPPGVIDVPREKHQVEMWRKKPRHACLALLLTRPTFWLFFFLLFDGWHDNMDIKVASPWRHHHPVKKGFSFACGRYKHTHTERKRATHKRGSLRSTATEEGKKKWVEFSLNSPQWRRIHPIGGRLILHPKKKGEEKKRETKKDPSQRRRRRSWAVDATPGQQKSYPESLTFPSMKFDDLLPAINPIIQRSARKCKKWKTRK